MPAADKVLARLSVRPWLLRLTAFANGGLLMLSFAPVGWFPLALVLLLPFLAVTLELPPRLAMRYGFWFGCGLFLTGTYWLYVSVHVFGQAPLAIAIFLMLALVLIMALYYAGTGWLIATLSHARPAWLVAIAPATWVAVEWLRGWFLTGFPWMTVGYGQIDAPLAGFAPLLGVYGVSLATVISAAALVAAVRISDVRRFVFLAVAVAPWLAGYGLERLSFTETAGPPVTTTIVQGGISQDRKWLIEQFPETIELYRQSLAAHPDSSLVVWPEVAIPALLHQVEGYVRQWQSMVRFREQSLLFGILERDPDDNRIYNSVIALDGTTRQVYRKRHLVPFGEYFPVPEFVREWMRLLSLPHSDLSAGEHPQPLLEMPDGNRLAVAICYEDAYAAEQLYALPDATLLINVSNDAWFGDSIAPHQHLEIARMRALEVERPVVRATNNGVSAFIGARGEILASGPQFELVILTRAVQPRTGLTPYARAGNWPVVGACLAVLAAAGWRRRRETTPISID